jgi:phospholipid/cholesterol/gamma-HCH transport system substrate-binding protein
MYSKVNYTLIGIFVMLLTAGMIFFAFWLGNSGFKDEYDLYLLRMKESVSGLSKDSSVKLKGVDIGTVSDIRVNPKNIEEIDIILKIKKGIPIKEDMRATISMFGLTGLSFVEIEGGSNESSTLQPSEGKMPVIKAGASVLNRLETNLGTLSDKMVAVLERGEKVLSDENLQNFSALLDHSNQIAARGTGVEEKLMSTLDEAEGALREFRVSFAELSKHYDALAVDLHKDIKPTVKKLDKMIVSTEKLVEKIFQTVNRGDYNMQKIMQPTMNDIRELSAQIDALTRQLRHSPSDILYKSATPRRGPGE